MQENKSRAKKGKIMDQIKIGKFIAECRKKKNLTQTQLAEKLYITNRAVSKWETGKSLPDASVMLELCEILEITVNDLLCGEVVVMENYKEKSEELLLEMVKEKEEKDKMLLRMEIIAGVLGIVPLLPATILANSLSCTEFQKGLIVLASIVPFLIAMPFLIKIEQKAGYYECKECGHRYVPEYKSVFWAMHMGRTRKMRCPKCNKKSWHKKVISREESL
jgi:transcriptional regulator with XRE-family HTH domain